MANSESSSAASTKSPTGEKAVRIGRFAIGFNVLIQLAVVAAIVVMVNYVSYGRHKRWDLSRSQKFALSSQTKNLLGSLEAPVKAIVFFPQAQMLSQDVFMLLREYEFTAGKNFSVEVVDPYRNLARARELSEKYKFGERDNIVILDYKGKSKFVNAQDMAEFDQSAMEMGGPPTVRAFKGEEAITSALLEVTEDRQNKLYLLGGHGEPALGDKAKIGSFMAYVARQNIKLEALNLNDVDAVPADATGVMIFGPKQDLSEREVQLLKAYWSEKKGRLFVLLNSQARTPRLNALLTEQGVTPQNDRVLKTGMAMTLDENNNPAMRSGILPAMATFTPASKPVAKDLVGGSFQFFGGATSLAVDEAQAQIQKVRIIPLLLANEGYWGETDYVPGETRQVFFDPQKDHMGPLTIAVAVEKGGLDDQRVKVDTSRMVIVGSDGYLTEEGLRITPTGIDFTLNALNWIFNRERVAGIPPKPKEALQLSLTEKQMSTLSFGVMLGMPGLVALLGLAVWWQRRA